MKKMRRLIPAIAMLLVSAVMLSTASFAWFTMNSDVTASGMQIQAKADSSLVISSAPLTATDGAPDLVFANTNVNKLIPITYNVTEEDTTIKGVQMYDATLPNGFIAAKDTDKVNIQTGMYEGSAYEQAANSTYITEVFYVASAGNSITGTLTFDLKAPDLPADAAIGAYKAYAAAVYVIDDPDDACWGADAVMDARDPSAIIFVDTTDSRHTYTTPTITVPSIIGAGEGENPAVGVKVVVRFYVDGALQDLVNTVKLNAGYVYTSETKYAEGGNYFAPTFTAVDTAKVEAAEKLPCGWYTKNDDTGIYTAVTPGANKAANTTYYEVTAYTQMQLTGDQQVPGADLPEGAYSRAMGQDNFKYTFVRTADVPSGGTSLEISVTCNEVTSGT